MDEKVKIRKKALHSRQKMTPEARAEKSRLILKALEAQDFFKKAGHILLYYTHQDEVDTRPLIEKYLDEKQLYLPVIRVKNRLEAVLLKKPLDLVKGREGVYEPAGAGAGGVTEGQIDLILVPGVAFDKKGNRLGMGKGYYDRYLQTHKKTVKVGLAFSEQVLDYVPKDHYDVPVDWVVTDQIVYQCIDF